MSPKVILEESIHDYFVEFDLGITKWNSEVYNTLKGDDSLGVFIYDMIYLNPADNIFWISAQDTVTGHNHYKIDIPDMFVNDTVRLAFYSQTVNEEAGNDVDVFIDNVKVGKVSENSFLDDLLLDNNTIQDFSPDIFNYTVNIDDIIPFVSAVVQDDHASISIKQPTGDGGSNGFDRSGIS